MVCSRYWDLGELPPGARVGTSSLRREAQLRQRYSQLDVQPLRGNVQTRLGKLDAGEFDAIILAAAGLKRLGLGARITAFLSVEDTQIDAGVTPAEAIKHSRAFPDLFADQFATGELTGSLDQALRRLHAYYQEEGTRKLHAFTQWAPRAVYFCVMLLIAALVVRWYANYFQQIGAAGGF